MNKNIFDYQSEVCKVFSNSRRLEIMNFLKKEERSVSDIAAELGLPLPNVSQHLTVMRMQRLLKARKEGATVYYRIASEELAYACSLMQDAISQILEAEDLWQFEHQALETEHTLQTG